MINEIPVKLPSQLRITKITTSFEKKFEAFSLNNSFEAENFEPKPTFEKTINDIKNNHMKSMASSAMNLSAITSFDEKIDLLSTNNSFEAEKL